MFCSKCGTKIEGQCCQSCGAPAGPAQVGSPTPAQPSMGDNAVGALCYLAGIVTGIVFLVIAPYNQRPEIRFHAFQSILFHVAWIGLLIVEMIVGVLLPFSLSVVLHLLGLVLWGGGFVLWLCLMWKAYENRPIELPVIGALARRQAAV